MKNLRIQNACNNCKHCHVETPYDDPYYFYCNINDDKPVQADYSKFLNVSAEEQKKISEQDDVWEKWCKGNEVRADNICDNYESPNGENQ